MIQRSENQHRTSVRKWWSAEAEPYFLSVRSWVNYTVMGLDCNALLLTDFSLKLSKAVGLPKLSSQWECHCSLNPTAPTTTNWQLHQQINNLSVTENWHLTAKGRLVRSALKNLSCCLRAAPVLGIMRGLQAPGLSDWHLWQALNPRAGGDLSFFLKQTLMVTIDWLAPATVHCRYL